jgi:hypothetical protein
MEPTLLFTAKSDGMFIFKPYFNRNIAESEMLYGTEGNTFFIVISFGIRWESESIIWFSVLGDTSGGYF